MLTSLIYLVENPEQAALISSLRDMIRRQDSELEGLRAAANQPPMPPQDRPETVVLVTSLREELQQQSKTTEALRQQNIDLSHAHEEEVRYKREGKILSEWLSQKIQLVKQIAEAQANFKQLQESKKEADKEQEDLLVFLEELAAKRKRDKERMRVVGMDVSEDEAEAEDE